MSMELAFSPAGHITVAEFPVLPEAVKDFDSGSGSGLHTKVSRAFASSQAKGLFLLVTEQLDSNLTPSMAYWRSFAGRYLTDLVHVSDPGLDATPLPDSAELDAIVRNAPPMQGAEYLTSDALASVWSDLDGWMRAAGAAFEGGLTAFLKRHAPLWHQVGRVCFHLAENRRDPDYPFAFIATYSPTVSTSSRVQYQPLSNALREYGGRQDKKTLIKLLSPVQIASQRSELARELIESGDIYLPLAWMPHQAYRFLQEVPLLEESGIIVRLPDWWKKRPRPRVSVTIGDNLQKRFDAQGMLDFQVQIALGDQQLSAGEWREMMAADQGLVLLRGQWVEVDRERLRGALKHWQQIEASTAHGLSFFEAMRLLAGTSKDLSTVDTNIDEQRDWTLVQAGAGLAKLLADLRRPEQLEQFTPAASLKTTLRDYQQTGVSWLSLLSSLGIGACLADDMGLGKTIQVLALLLAVKTQGTGQRKGGHKPSVLLLPASLVANWKSEIEKFAPSLRAAFVHPSEMPADELTRMASQSAHELQNIDLVVSTYGMLQRQPWLLDIEWRLVVLDEAQAIKNPAARQTRLVKRLKGNARIALTGTPIENRLSDLWSLFDFLNPGLLGSQQKFKEFIKRLDSQPPDHRYAALRNLVQPYILRRLKTDKRVISDLPDKTEVRAFCGLSKRQVVLYTMLVKELAAALVDLEGIKRRGLVLAYLMRFKQLCNHPSQLTSDGVFETKDSGKFLRLVGICEEVAARQEKVLIFTQFRQMTDPLSSCLASVFGRPGLVLHGSTAVGKRQQLVDQFQRDDGPPYFVLSLKAGGTGLNLTAASHVIHFDRWWNPAVENQATDRAFRIGQKRNVLVHKFVCEGTIEEKIDALIAGKTQLADDILTGGAEQLLTEMSDREIIQLISLDVDRASV